MAKGTSIQKHGQKMERIFQDLESLGTSIDGKMAQDFFLASLSDDFTKFIVNYKVNRFDHTFTDMIDMCCEFEQSFKKDSGRENAITRKRLHKKNARKSKGTCFHCGKDERWKKKYGVRIVNLMTRTFEGTISVIKSAFTVNSNSWIFDSGASQHICNSLQGLTWSRTLRNGEMIVRVGNDTKISAKMYHTIRPFYYWPGMKREIAEYVSWCAICQQVKAERKKPFGLMQPLPVPQWKWENITMDFVYKLPRTRNGYDGVWVIVDQLTKLAHFIPVREKYSLNELVELFLSKIVKYHGTLVSIISDRDPRFTSKFWKAFQEAFGAELRYNTAYHPQTDGQSERTIQNLEDMLRASVLQFGDDWHAKLDLMELAYNNSYHSSIGMAQFEALYGKACRTPLCWSEVGERPLVGPEIVEETTHNVQVIKANMEAAQDRQKSLADRHAIDRVYAVSDWVFLKLSP